MQIATAGLEQGDMGNGPVKPALDQVIVGILPGWARIEDSLRDGHAVPTTQRFFVHPIPSPPDCEKSFHRGDNSQGEPPILKRSDCLDHYSLDIR